MSLTHPNVGCCAGWLLAMLFCGAVAADEPSAEELLAKAWRAAGARQSDQTAEHLRMLFAKQSVPDDAYYLRGREQLRQGQFAAAVGDFDAYLERVPARRASLWERGIACYFAGQYRAGAAQFSAYQTYDDNDVENGVWHLACLARAESLPQARSAALTVRRDGRVPMTAVYALFRGVGDSNAVLQAAEQESRTAVERHHAYFYAYLYLGLYHELLQERDQAKAALGKAVHEFKIDHYMWDVARIQLATFDARQAKEE